MKKKAVPLRVGFDLDGVLLYNPARIVRPIIAWIKRAFLHKKKLKFYYPASYPEKLMWRLFHRSSIYNAGGLDDIRRMVADGEIEAYLITARFNFLGHTVLRWIKKNHLENTFKEVYFNSKDEQPHLFKERMVNKLDLDVFVEDNYDIVDHLSKKTSALIIWIYNIFDRNISYPHKFPGLKRVILYLSSTQ